MSLGGDSDTLAAITGSIAETFYGVPEELRQECRKRLTPELAEILRRWESAWHTALSTVNAVYLIVDRENGRKYVGSAYGKGDLLGRWMHCISWTI